MLRGIPAPLRRAGAAPPSAQTGTPRGGHGGEAPGYRGARISGLPFTSERQLTGDGPAEATATIVQRSLAELGLVDEVLLWNIVPTHPGTARSNRAPTRREVWSGRAFAERLAAGRRVIAVGRIAAAVLEAAYVRHPSHGGAVEFSRGLAMLASGADREPSEAATLRRRRSFDCRLSER